MKEWKIRVIHLSHTDIGYKDIQSKIIEQQTSNLLDVVNVLKNKPKQDWKWNIESFGTIKDFIEKHPHEEEELAKLIKENKIGISANFWNYSKIASKDLIEASFKMYKDFTNKHNIYSNSMITNDINGYAASWAIEAEKKGINNLFFGLHSHHGFYPAFRKQYPFWWKLPNGSKVFVWIGEQYAFGNNMGLVPGPISDYIAKDTLTAGTNIDDQIKLSNKRIKEYTETLEKEKYPFSVIPITVLGTGADNDPANYEIEDRIEILKKEWKSYGVSDIKMVTLDEFFDEVKNEKINTEIPTYEGEWPDWWTNGVGSAPHALRAFKEAQRNYKIIKRVSPNYYSEDIEKDLLLFAEHTFGTEDALRYNHNQYNFRVEKIKSMYAYKALNSSLNALSEITKWKSHRQSNKTKIEIQVKNPYNVEVTKSVNITKFLGWSEKDKFLSLKNPKIMAKNNIIPYSIKTIPHPAVKAWDAKEIIAHIKLQPQEIFNIEIDLNGPTKNDLPMTNSFSTITAELADDVENINNPKNGIKFINNILETKFYKITFNENGISKIYSKELKKDIINENQESLFQPVYLVDSISDNDRNKLFLSRRNTGKNMFANTSIKYTGKFLTKKIEINKNRNDVEIIMNYQLKNSKFYEVNLSLSMHHNKIYSQININKDTEWSNESLFISLPFNGKLKLEYDHMYEIGKGQIPGTLVDYHSILEGSVVGDVLISQLDSSLVWTNNFNYGDRLLATKDYQHVNKFYSWVLNNCWETNFSADTSGFHAFRYIIEPKTSNDDEVEKLFANSSEILLERK